MQCPATSKEKDIRASDVSFARHLEEFYKIGSVPGQLNVEELNHGQEIKHTLKERKAVWDKTCRNSFSNANLEREKKGKYDRENEKANSYVLGTESTSSPVKARRSGHPCSSFRAYCLFCDLSDVAAIFPAGSTLVVERILRECASLVNYNMLIGKLASGDMVAIQAKYHAKGLVGLFNQAAKLKLSFNSENVSL